MYVQKMKVIIDDKSKFAEVNEEDTLSRLSRFQSFLYRNFKSLLTEQEYKDIFPKTKINLVVLMRQCCFLC